MLSSEMTKQPEVKKFFYCYSPVLFEFLRYEKQISFICTGKHIDTDKQFWQFDRTDQINEALKEFSNRKNSLKK